MGHVNEGSVAPAVTTGDSKQHDGVNNAKQILEGSGTKQPKKQKKNQAVQATKKRAWPRQKAKLSW
jgi:hypothetical protein